MSEQPNHLERKWSTLPIRLKGGLAIALPAITLMLVSLANINIEGRQEAADRLVSSTELDRAKVRQLLESLIDAETGVRGYALTHNPVFLQPYNSAAVVHQKLELEIKKNNSSGNEANAESVIRASRVAFEGVELIKKQVDNGHGITDESVNFAVSDGKLRMDHLRIVVDRFDTERVHFLKVHEAKLSSLRHTMRAGNICALTIVLLGGLLSTYILNRVIIARIARLCHVARVLATGSPLPDLPPSSDEIGTLMAGMQEASDLLIEREQALIHKNQDLALALDRVREASEHKSRFLANMSHELRTPLNSIIGFTEVLHDKRAGELNDIQEEFLGDSLRSARHLLSLINDILDLEKIAAGHVDFSPERFDLHVLISEVIHDVSVTNAAKRVRIVSECDDDVRWVFLDQQKTKQILLNFLSNAAKFSFEGGGVMVRARAAGSERCVLEVEDKGIGISDKDQARLFREFEQLENSASKRFQGTGLGLAITKKLVEAQGGKVLVESRVGSGSTFSAILPVKLDFAAAKCSASVSERRIETILVVDDGESSTQKSLASALEECGCTVELVNNADQALSNIKKIRYRALVTGFLLPNGSGLDLVREIRKQEHSADLPIIIATGTPDQFAPQGFIVSDALTSAARPDELVAILSRIRQSEENAEIVIVDDDRDVHKLARVALKGFPFQVVSCFDGESGLRQIERSRPAAVIVDLLMPNLDGFNFVSRLQHIPGASSIPVVVWTNLDLSREEIEILKHDVKQVIYKRDGGISRLIQELEKELREHMVEVGT